MLNDKTFPRSCPKISISPLVWYPFIGGTAVMKLLNGYLKSIFSYPYTCTGVEITFSYPYTCTGVEIRQNSWYFAGPITLVFRISESHYIVLFDIFQSSITGIFVIWSSRQKTWDSEIANNLKINTTLGGGGQNGGGGQERGRGGGGKNGQLINMHIIYTEVIKILVLYCINAH